MTNDNTSSRMTALEAMLFWRSEFKMPFTDVEVSKFLDDAGQDPEKAMLAMEEAWSAVKAAQLQSEGEAHVRAMAAKLGLDPDVALEAFNAALEEEEGEIV